MAERVADALRSLRSQSVYSRDRDLVFCHPETGKPLDRSKLVRRFKQAIERGDVHRITFHELRHYVDGWVMWPAGAFSLLGLVLGPVPAT
jgi:integrase